MPSLKERINVLRAARMRRRGLDTMLVFDALMRENGIAYSLAYGTLLGAVREKGFIKHDTDIDVAMWMDSTDLQKLHKAMTGAGFRFKRRISVENGRYGHEETYVYKGMRLDIFFFYPYDGDTFYVAEYYYQPGCGWNESKRKFGGLRTIQVPLPLSKEVEYVPFENISLPITKSAIGFVSTRYGEGWRVPDPTFVWPKIGDVRYIERPDWTGVVSHDINL